MSVGFLKRIFSFLNVLAVLLFAATAYGFWDHRQQLAKPPVEVDFKPEVTGTVNLVGPVRYASIPLGRFPKKMEVPQGPAESVEETQTRIEDALSKLGQIKGATVVYPPYNHIYPTILFEFQDGTIKTIALNEALEEKPHPDPELAPHFKVPAAYKFIGCEPDEKNTKWTYFKFDMKCDGTDIQRAHWKGEGETEALPEAQGGRMSGIREGSDKGIWIGDAERKNAKYVPPRVVKAEPTPERPTQPQPASQAKPAGRLAVREAGAWRTTAEGSRFLKDNYEKLLEDATTARYKDKRTGRTGVLVTGIRPGSPANGFGIQTEDVILSINGTSVKDQKHAVRIVQRELKKANPPRYITVKILRNGRELTEKYDTEDPETRRKARELGRR